MSAVWTDYYSIIHIQMPSPFALKKHQIWTKFYFLFSPLQNCQTQCIAESLRILLRKKYKKQTQLFQMQCQEVVIEYLAPTSKTTEEVTMKNSIHGGCSFNWFWIEKLPEDHTCKKREIVEIYLCNFFWIFRKILG